MNFSHCKFLFYCTFYPDTNFFLCRMLPTLGLIAYDTLAAHPAAECSRYVAHELSLFGNKLIEFPWDEFR